MLFFIGWSGNPFGWVTFGLRSSSPESVLEEYFKQKEWFGHKMEMTLVCFKYKRPMWLEHLGGNGYSPRER